MEMKSGKPIKSNHRTILFEGILAATPEQIFQIVKEWGVSLELAGYRIVVHQSGNDLMDIRAPMEDVLTGETRLLNAGVVRIHANLQGSFVTVSFWDWEREQDGEGWANFNGFACIPHAREVFKILVTDLQRMIPLINSDTNAQPFTPSGDKMALTDKSERHIVLVYDYQTCVNKVGQLLGKKIGTVAEGVKASPGRYIYRVFGVISPGKKYYEGDVEIIKWGRYSRVSIISTSPAFLEVAGEWIGALPRDGGEWMQAAGIPKEPKTIPQPETNSGQSPYEKAVFVSYAWEDGSVRIVDELEQAFAKRGIHIERDKKVLDYKDSIKAFEQRIGQGQCIVLVISDKYLRSEHCMYEMVEADRKQNLRERIFPIVLADAQIYEAIDRLNYVEYWDGKIKQLNQAIKEKIEVMTNLSGITNDLDKYMSIRASIAHLTDLLMDMNALTPEIHATSGFSTLIDAVERAMTQK